jgi:hypothetical protein
MFHTVKFANYEPHKRSSFTQQKKCDQKILFHIVENRNGEPHERSNFTL